MKDNILDFDIYKAEYNNVSRSYGMDITLMSNLRHCFLHRDKLSDDLLSSLQVANSNFDSENIKRIVNSKHETRIDYYCVLNNHIICVFQHIYDPYKKEIILAIAITEKSMRKIGYGTLVYNKVIEDIFEVFKATKILATAVSTGGKKMLAKLGFLYDKQNSYKKNMSVLLFNPNNEDKSIEKQYIPLDKYLKTHMELKDDSDEMGEFIENIL